MSEECYTTGFNDFTNNSLFSFTPVYKNLKDAVKDINSKMIDTLSSKFDIHPQGKHIFSEDKMKETGELTIKINDTKRLKFLRTENIIDIYHIEISKGYIYNKEIVRHVYKFFINENSNYKQAIEYTRPLCLQRENENNGFFKDEFEKQNGFQPTINEKLFPSCMMEELKKSIQKFKID